MRDEGFDVEAELGEVGERGVDRADFVEFDDAEARGGRRSLQRHRSLAASPLALGAGLGVASAGQADVDVELAAGFFFLGGDEVVELAAGGEPFFAAVEVDVVDGQPAGRSLGARRGS